MNKKQIVEELSTNSRFSKQTLLKMNLPELKKLFAEISSKQQQPDPEPEPKPVTRREPVLRDFSSDDEEEEESEDQKEEAPVKQRISNVKQQIIKQPKKNKNKIKPPKVEIKNDESEDEGNRSPTPPPSPRPLSTSELRKVLRTDYFKHYEKDIKEVINEYNRGDFGENCLVAEYNLLRDEFVDKLQSFLDSQRKLSEAQLDYVDSLLQRVADKVQDALNKR